MDIDHSTDTISPDGSTAYEPLRIGGTGGILVSNGTTAERPTGENGTIRYNTTLNRIEGYINGAWDQITQASEFDLLVNSTRTALLIDLSAAGATYTLSELEASHSVLVFAFGTVDCVVTYPTIYDYIVPSRVYVSTLYNLYNITIYVQTQAAGLLVPTGGNVELVMDPANLTPYDTYDYVSDLANSVNRNVSYLSSTTETLNETNSGNIHIFTDPSGCVITVGPIGTETAVASGAKWSVMSTAGPITLVAGSGITLFNNKVIPPFHSTMLYRSGTTNDIYVCTPEEYTTVASSVTAAGSNQGTATLLTSTDNIITTVAASTGVKLPQVYAGKRISVTNKGANTLNIYPATGASIDNGAANAAATLLASEAATFLSTSSTTWSTVSSHNATSTGDVVVPVITTVDFGTGEYNVSVSISDGSATADDQLHAGFIHGGTMSAEEAAIQGLTIACETVPTIGYVLHCAAPNGAVGTVKVVSRVARTVNYTTTMVRKEELIAQRYYGTTGDTFTNSAVDPSGGADGDMHRNTVSDHVWTKKAGVWVDTGVAPNAYPGTLTKSYTFYHNLGVVPSHVSFVMKLVSTDHQQYPTSSYTNGWTLNNTVLMPPTGNSWDSGATAVYSHVMSLFSDRVVIYISQDDGLSIPDKVGGNSVGKAENHNWEMQITVMG